MILYGIFWGLCILYIIFLKYLMYRSNRISALLYNIFDYIYQIYNINLIDKRKSIVVDYFNCVDVQLLLNKLYKTYNNYNPFDKNNYVSVNEIIDPDSELGKEFNKYLEAKK